MKGFLYYNSKLLQHVLTNTDKYSYEMLDSCSTKLECMNYLKEIYKISPVETLTNIDYNNLYDICYILCEKNNDYDHSHYRQIQANSFVKEIKNYPSDIVALIDRFCK